MNSLNKIFVFLAAVFSLSSCVKEEPLFKDGGNSGMNGIVELALSARTSSTAYQTSTTTIEVQDSFALPIKINYTGTEGAPSDISVTLSIDNDALTQYNDKQSTSYIVPESSFYSFSSKVIIPKGKKTVTDTIWLYTKNFDLSLSYALPVTISSSSSGIISGNYGTGIYVIPLKSPWEGNYTVTINWDFSGSSLGDYQEYFPETLNDITLSTYSPGVVAKDYYLGDLFSAYTYYKFNSDGTIGFSTSSSSITNIKVLESNYDVDNLTFHIKVSFKHPSYGNFILEETYKQQN